MVSFFFAVYSLLHVQYRHASFGGFSGGSDGKSACNAGDLGLIPGLGRSPGEENSNPLQYSCLENSTDRGAWQPTLHGIENSLAQLSDFHITCVILL